MKDVKALVDMARVIGIGQSAGDGQEGISVAIGTLALPPVAGKQIFAIVDIDVVVILVRAFGVRHCKSIKAILARLDKRIQKVLGAVAVVEVLVPPDDEDIPDHVVTLGG